MIGARLANRLLLLHLLLLPTTSLYKKINHTQRLVRFSYNKWNADKL